MTKTLVFPLFSQTDRYTDMALANDEGSYRCHRLVIAACSPYLADLINRTMARDQVIVLSRVPTHILMTLIR